MMATKSVARVPVHLKYMSKIRMGCTVAPRMKAVVYLITMVDVRPVVS